MFFLLHSQSTLARDPVCRRGNSFESHLDFSHTHTHTHTGYIKSVIHHKGARPHPPVVFCFHLIRGTNPFCVRKKLLTPKGIPCEVPWPNMLPACPITIALRTCKAVFLSRMCELVQLAAPHLNPRAMGRISHTEPHTFNQSNPDLESNPSAELGGYT